MSEMTQEEALRLADALAGQAQKETEARCSVLAQFIGDCDRAGSRTSAWSEALRELHTQHGYRSGSCAGAALFSKHSSAPWASSQRRCHCQRRRTGPCFGLSDRFRFERGGGHQEPALRRAWITHLSQGTIVTMKRPTPGDRRAFG
jgi:hypothetical protein